MKILILSQYGDGLGLAQKIISEGHKVFMFIRHKGYEWAGKGLVTRVQAWRPKLPEVDLVICDMVGFGRYQSVFRRMGIPAFSCSRIADMLELDREKTYELFKKVGIGLPETQSFRSPADAADILRTWESPGYVLKPHGNTDTAKTFVARDSSIYRWALSTYPSNQALSVQQIVSGIEVSTEGWFNGRGWLHPFTHTFEEKRFLPEGGPNTGCMGNVVVGSASNKLTQGTVERLTPFLKQIGYRGPIDINSIVNDDGIFALEATPRLGYDAIEAVMEGLQGSITDLIFETAMGISNRIPISLTERFIAVRLSIPPWPHADPEGKMRGMPILGLGPENLRHIYLTDVYLEDGSYKYAASDGVVMKVTAHGRNASEARGRAYRTIDNLTIPEVQYRKDIGSRVEDDISSLKSLGYLNG